MLPFWCLAFASFFVDLPDFMHDRILIDLALEFDVVFVVWSALALRIHAELISELNWDTCWEIALLLD